MNIETIKQKKYPIIYILLAIGITVSYLPAREAMIPQTAWLWVVKSPITLNFVVLFFLYGVACDKMTKGMTKKKSWLVWGVGLLILILLFSVVGGMSTIFD